MDIILKLCYQILSKNVISMKPLKSNGMAEAITYCLYNKFDRGCFSKCIY